MTVQDDMLFYLKRIDDHLGQIAAAFRDNYKWGWPTVPLDEWSEPRGGHPAEAHCPCEPGIKSADGHEHYHTECPFKKLRDDE